MTLSALGIFSAAGAGGVAAVPDYELISTNLITTNTSSVTFDVSSLASTYKHLQIRATGRQSASFVLLGVRMRLGSPSVDSGSNYAEHFLKGQNGSVTSYGGASISAFDVSYDTGASASANIFGAAVIDILDPFSTTKNTTVRSLAGVYAGTGTSHAVTLFSGHWRNTAAVQTIQLIPAGSNFVSGSRFSIYGIKG